MSTDEPIVISGPIVFFTGAGISVGSGLPTYRGADGLYEKSGLEPPSIDDVTRERLPDLWARFRPRLDFANAIVPSAAHHAIAEIERRSAEPVTVVTQNVDGLHTSAGSTNVAELHGSLLTMRCLDFGHVMPSADAAWLDGVPRCPHCPHCSSMCRPNVVLFGERLPAEAWNAATRAIAEATTIVAVGTSAQVYPAASLIDFARSPDAVHIWVNPETESPSDRWMWLHGSADTQVTRLHAVEA